MDKSMLILEYLTDEQKLRYDYANKQRNPVATKATDHYFGEGNDVVHVNPEENRVKSDTHRAIEAHVGQEMSVSDYAANRAKTPKGNPIKLTKLIKDPELMKKYQSDPVRSGGGSDGHYYSVVRGIHVAGQTNPEPNEQHPTGHSWHGESCKNVTNGINRSYLENEIKEGTVAVFAHDHTGKEIYRATLQPHHPHSEHKGNTNARVYTFDAHYGLKNPEFAEFAKKTAHDLSNQDPEHHDKIFVKNPYVYNDSGQNYAIHPKASEASLQNIFRSAADHFELMEHSPSEKETEFKKEKFKNDKYHKIFNSMGRFSLRDLMASSMSHPNMSEESQKMGLDRLHDNAKKNKYDDDSTATLMYVVRMTNFRNPQVLSDHLKSTNKHIARAAAMNSHTGEHLDEAINHNDSSVRMRAAKNPKFSKAHIERALASNDQNIKDDVVEYSRLPKSTQLKYINSKNETDRNLLLRNEHVHPDVLTHAINNPNEKPYNIIKAVTHNNADATHVRLGLNHPNPDVRYVAQNLVKKVTGKSLNENVAMSVANNPVAGIPSDTNPNEPPPVRRKSNTSPILAVIKRKPVMEYLTPDQRERFSQYKMDDDARERTDKFFGKGNDVVREVADEDEPDISEVHNKIQKHLGTSISKAEYRSGLMKDPNYPNRQIRIGKMIADNPNLAAEYAVDRQYTSNLPKGHYMTIVRGTEVAGQTNDAASRIHPGTHSWRKSCKHCDRGLLRHILPDEIRRGTVVVFGHDHNGKEIYRATLQPHHSLDDSDRVVYALNSHYGIKNNAFVQHVHDVARRLSVGVDDPRELFRIDDQVHDNKRVEKNLHSDPILHPALTSNDLTKLQKTLKPVARMHRFIQDHPNADSKVLKFYDKSGSMNEQFTPDDRFAGTPVFNVDSHDFVNARLGKQKGQHFSQYITNQDTLNRIRGFAEANWKSPIMVRNETTGEITHLKYGHGMADLPK